MVDESPKTLRTGACPSCAELRHQLGLADLLAAQIAPIVADIKSAVANSTEPMCQKDCDLVAAHEIYAAARVRYESERPNEVH